MHSPSEWNRPGPLVIAHRGASARAPENTLAALRLAADLGAEAVECDARLTRDGHVVLLHDPTVDRTTDGRGRVRDLTLGEVRSLDAGSKHGPGFSGAMIPTLDEAFEELGTRLLFNVHLNNDETPFDALVGRTVEVIRRHGMGRRVLASSFHPLVLGRLRRQWPDLPIGLLLWPPSPAAARFLFRHVTAHEALHPEVSMVTPEMVGGEHRARRRVNVWTVDDPARIGELISMGVDGVITNAPDVARKVVLDVGHRA